MGREQTGPRAKSDYVAALKTESDRLSLRVAELNREMMRLPIDKRRARWQEYCGDLGRLMERQRELSTAMDALSKADAKRR